MEDSVELYWRNIEDNLNHARHHEAMRTSTTNIIVTISGAAFAIIGYDKMICAADLPLLLFVAVLGIYGALFSAKQTERASLHYIRAHEYRRAIDREEPDIDFLSLRKSADETHKKRYPRLTQFELQSLWIGIHIGITVLALVVTASWLFSPSDACTGGQLVPPG
jgi:hypothetical protein